MGKKKLIKAHKKELKKLDLKTKCCDKYKKGKACGRCPYMYLLREEIIVK
jgi:hypothetical protein